MATAERFDAIVIGGGPAGYTGAIRLAQLGQRTLCVEKEDLGGVCLNWGCIPSKALIDTAHMNHKLKDLEAVGLVGMGAPRVEVAKLQAWKNSIVKKLVSGVGSLLKSNGASTVFGTARITGPNSVSVALREGGEKQYEAKAIVIATGSSTIGLPSLPFDGRTIVGAREAVSLDAIPKRLLVLGGGVIGLELGSMYQNFGAQVTVVEALPQLLTGVDKDCVAVAQRSLAKRGMTILVNHKAMGHERTKTGIAVKVVDDKGVASTIEVDVVLVAIGMAPNSKGLGLETVGITPDAKGFIATNEVGRTNVPSIYAVGDVSGAPLLAHKAFKEAVVTAEVIAGHRSAKDWKTIPAAVFTDPEIAYAGLTEEEAVRKGREVKVGRMPFAASGRAMAMRETEGFVKTVMDKSTHEILGVHIVGPRASDMISEAALGIEMGAFAEDIALTIHPHPTLGEAMMISSEHALGQATDILNR
ncbi:Dihydrolipoamide dehydrogenase of branched-chain alpha-keto acid dehydrogenase [Labilithrix luteola]|uniref:Dihydrolipoyl dehydrogenase n=1 Tax=Labilithrix luteola TaxID=1391654 RepID=A0A0K1PK51_9BACT|nr:dihydrolipoyl dehydrogenase [Labilithrix luteola]AKU93766.1 Dihydrolipoamide dehydrogenase of branched-chain alpha-keto acid dehydrogenase [Labilithrix luteola]